MSPVRTVFAVAIALAVVACTDTPTAVETDLEPQFGKGEVVQSATGSGHFRLNDGSLRTFTASARLHADGSVSGQSQLNNRSAGAKVHTSIDCLFIDGNLAIMSGVVTSSNFPNRPVGSGIIWAVEDNGEGTNAPADRISFTFNFPTGPDVCKNPPIESLFIPIEKGNIQVRG